jgi:hypothetical protein
MVEDLYMPENDCCEDLRIRLQTLGLFEPPPPDYAWTIAAIATAVTPIVLGFLGTPLAYIPYITAAVSGVSTNFAANTRPSYPTSQPILPFYGNIANMEVSESLVSNLVEAGHLSPTLDYSITDGVVETGLSQIALGLQNLNPNQIEENIEFINSLDNFVNMYSDLISPEAQRVLGDIRDFVSASIIIEQHPEFTTLINEAVEWLSGDSEVAFLTNLALIPPENLSAISSVISTLDAGQFGALVAESPWIVNQLAFVATDSASRAADARFEAGEDAGGVLYGSDATERLEEVEAEAQTYEEFYELVQQHPEFRDELFDTTYLVPILYELFRSEEIQGYLLQELVADIDFSDPESVAGAALRTAVPAALQSALNTPEQYQQMRAIVDDILAGTKLVLRSHRTDIEALRGSINALEQRVNNLPSPRHSGGADNADFQTSNNMGYGP